MMENRGRAYESGNCSYNYVNLSDNSMCTGGV